MRPIAAGGGGGTVNPTVDASNRDAESWGTDEELSEDPGTGTLSVLIGTVSGTEYQAGFQFALAVPQGATITAATLEVDVDAALGTPNGNAVTIHVFDVDNAAVFNAAHTHALTSHATTSGTTVTGWTTTWGSAGTKTSPSIASLVQVVVNRGGWVSGNYIGFVLESETWDDGDSSALYSRDEGTASQATLNVTYTE